MRPILGSLRGLGRGVPLFGALLVLPAVVLMILHAGGLYRAYTSDLDAIPLRAEHDRLQLLDLVDERFRQFLAAEEQRPYFQYATTYSPDASFYDDLVLLSSPILEDPVPSPLQAWFYMDVVQDLDSRRFELIVNENGDLGDHDQQPDFEIALFDMLGLMGTSMLPELSSGGRGVDVLQVPMVTAAVHADRARHEDCLRTCLPLMRAREVSVAVSRFQLMLFRDSAGHMRLAAVREVRPAEVRNDISTGVPIAVPKGGRCLEALADGFHDYQGFLIDPSWVFQRLAEEHSALILENDARLVSGLDARLPAGEGELKRSLDLVTLLDIQEAGDLVWFRNQQAILTDTKAPLARFRASILRFSAVVLMMFLSLSTGLVLLLGNVRQKLAQARRTENFVAAVTHELRTPLASIRLHGEMLADGIASTPEARSEYYQRILGETERLSLLVENVLQKSSLDSEAASSEPGDLTAMIELMGPQLEEHGAHYSSGESEAALELDLARDLPKVQLHWDALNGILRNLVGNARKYGGDTQVTVRTRQVKDRVLLEVLDRGPGVASGEERRIFEAFYRTGDEATRERPGTGLGLHLVQLHASALGAEASYRPRKGGGSAFVVAFPPVT